MAVCDLERASATWRGLGFMLTPGRALANGIRNAHVKFPDDSGIELLTAPHAADSLSSRYVDLLRAGEGPAFLSFHARDTTRLRAALREGGYRFRPEGAITDLDDPEFSWLFLIRDNRSPTDQPGHFAHPNGAVAMSAVWTATDDGDALARLLVRLGGRRERRLVLAPDEVEATVVTLAEGEVIILPGSRRILAGRPVIGATFMVPDLAGVRAILEKARIEPREGGDAAGRLVVEPAIAHGLWVEFQRRP